MERDFEAFVASSLITDSTYWNEFLVGKKKIESNIQICRLICYVDWQRLTSAGVTCH